MSKQFLNPETVHEPRNYTHAVTVQDARKLVFVAGQVSMARDRTIVGVGDLKAQAEQTFENFRLALAAAGATPDHVVKITTFVVDMKPADRSVVHEARRRALGTKLPASSLIGVAALVEEELLIEVEGIAVID